MKNEYKNLLNEMIPNAERFGSRMDLAKHQAARMKKVIDAHNADVDAKTFPSNAIVRQPFVALRAPEDVSARARRIQSIAQVQGAKINPRGTPAMSGNTISPNELKLAELDPSNKKPMSTVNFSRLSDEDRQKGQVEADKLRTTGLSDRRVKAGQAAEDARREKITRAFTFESLTQTYINILRETYRITPKRREVLSNIEGRARQDAVDQLTRSPSVMTGSSSMSDQNDFLMNISKISRIEAIKQMGLPQDVRIGRGQGLNDRQLKTVMRNSREAQKNFEYLKRRGSINELSNKTLASYIKKASGVGTGPSFIPAPPREPSPGNDVASLDDKAHGSYTFQNLQKLKNRKQGIGRAVDQLSKRLVDAKYKRLVPKPNIDEVYGMTPKRDAILKREKKKTVKEEVLELDETSKELKLRYIMKASGADPLNPSKTRSGMGNNIPTAIRGLERNL